VLQVMEFRRLGRSGVKVSPLGLGTARMAGLGWREDLAPQVSSQAKRDAVRQIQAAVDLGVTFFDTADNYGQGLSERILGEALRGRRDGIVVATKFGEDPMPDQEDPWSLDAGSVKRKCEASLRRLGVECIDLCLLHRRDYPLEQAPALMEVLEDLVRAGKIRYYGWSTDDVERARLFARGEHCIAIEHRLNIMMDAPAMLALCDELDLASINRIPLAMGLLSGRWTRNTQLPQDDRRGRFFEVEEFLQDLEKVQAMRQVITRDGRSYVQAALGWIWARSPRTIPVPGFRTIEHIEENAQAMRFGPLNEEQMGEIQRLLSR
jgi:aryl-alcohol dehydrogenase-like predicted oxidoreductase